MSKRPPNILYLNTHDTGRVVGPMGTAARTPNFAALAADGVLFRNCHCAGPTCSPSRAALITGMVPHSCGMLGLAHRGWSLSDPSWTLPSHLRQHGYATAAWNMPGNHCSSHLQGDKPTQAKLHGYDTFIPGSDIADACAWLESPPEQPFFLSVSWVLTHRIGRGFTVKPDAAQHDPRWTAPPAPLPDTPETRADWAHFLCDIAEWDRQLGLVLAALEKSGRAQDTIVVVTTDHGPPFPAMKCNPTVHGTGVFLAMRGPGFSGGQAIDQLVSQIDLFPTLCAAAGLPVPDRVQGVNLRPTLEGRPVRDHVTAEVTHHAAYEPWRAYRTSRHLYVLRFGERRQTVLPNCDSSPSRDVWLEGGLRQLQYQDEELYDTLFDPQERRNLAADPLYAAVVRDLRERLHDWMHATNDPLLNGPVPLPPHGVTTSVDGLNPDGAEVKFGGGVAVVLPAEVKNGG
jgi:arylsulfatase A-like enzyme